MMDALDRAIVSTQSHLDALRNERGHWEGHLSSSALSTATAIVALSLVDSNQHAVHIEAGACWLREHQNADGGWGDTTLSFSNISTTVLCHAAFHGTGKVELHVETVRRADAPCPPRASPQRRGPNRGSP